MNTCTHARRPERNGSKSRHWRRIYYLLSVQRAIDNRHQLYQRKKKDRLTCKNLAWADVKDFLDFSIWPLWYATTPSSSSNLKCLYKVDMEANNFKIMSQGTVSSIVHKQYQSVFTHRAISGYRPFWSSLRRLASFPWERSSPSLAFARRTPATESQLISRSIR